MQKNKIKIVFVLKSFHPFLLDIYSKKILNNLLVWGFKFKKVSFLPQVTQRFTLLRSPHVYKKARDQFELKTYKRLFYVEKVLILPIDKKIWVSIENWLICFNKQISGIEIKIKFLSVLL